MTIQVLTTPEIDLPFILFIVVTVIIFGIHIFTYQFNRRNVYDLTIQLDSIYKADHDFDDFISALENCLQVGDFIHTVTGNEASLDKNQCTIKVSRNNYRGGQRLDIKISANYYKFFPLVKILLPELVVIADKAKRPYAYAPLIQKPDIQYINVAQLLLPAIRIVECAFDRTHQFGVWFSPFEDGKLSFRCMRCHLLFKADGFSAAITTGFTACFGFFDKQTEYHYEVHFCFIYTNSSTTAFFENTTAILCRGGTICQSSSLYSLSNLSTGYNELCKQLDQQLRSLGDVHHFPADVIMNTAERTMSYTEYHSKFQQDSLPMSSWENEKGKSPMQQVLKPRDSRTVLINTFKANLPTYIIIEVLFLAMSLVIFLDEPFAALFMTIITQSFFFIMFSGFTTFSALYLYWNRIHIDGKGLVHHKWISRYTFDFSEWTSYTVVSFPPIENYDFRHKPLWYRLYKYLDDVRVKRALAGRVRKVAMYNTSGNPRDINLLGYNEDDIAILTTYLSHHIRRRPDVEDDKLY